MSIYSQRHQAWLIQEGQWIPTEEIVACEIPVHVYCGETLIDTVLCTPKNLDDLAYGLLYAQGYITQARDIVALDVSEEEDSFRIDVTISCEDKQRGEQKNQSAYTSVSEPFQADTVNDRENICPLVACDAIYHASAQLLERQKMHLETGATHAAVFVAPSGIYRYMREDIGRHNAVDKLIGVLLRQEVDPLEGFVYLSSRCAFDLVEKCARYGIRLVATVSAPTTAVIRFAEKNGVTLCAFARENRFTIYTHQERIFSA